MKRYFSSVLTGGGIYCPFNSLDFFPENAKIFYVFGEDTERAVFFEELSKRLRGFSLTLFNPFYDEGCDGIYISGLNIYIIGTDLFCRPTPAFAGKYEKYLFLNPENAPSAEEIRVKREKMQREKQLYRLAGDALKKACVVKSRLYEELFPFLDEGKMINFLRRFTARKIKPCTDSGTEHIRLLCSPTPLGIYTHWDTVFDLCSETVSINDNTGLAGTVICSAVRDYAKSEGIPVISSPSYFSPYLPCFLIFPVSGLGIVLSTENHPLPYTPNEQINSARFLKPDLPIKKAEALLGAENSFLDKCVQFILRGRQESFSDRSSLAADTDSAKAAADNLAERIIKNLH